MAIKRVKTGWQADIQPTGYGGRRYRKTFPTKGEAKRWCTYVRSKVQQQPEWEMPKRDRRRLSHLVEQWYQHHGKRLHFDQHKRLQALAIQLGDPFLEDFRVQDFVKYREARLSEGITEATLNREHSYLRAMFNELKRLGLLDKDNPLSGLRQLKVSERELRYLTGEEIRALLKESDQSTNRDLGLVIRICLSIGSRWSEAETLTLKQIKDGRIDLYGVGTKSGKNRSVPISDDIRSQLVRHAQGKQEGRIFSNCYGAYRIVIKRAGIRLPKGQMSHVLRHTFASHFMMNGGNIIVLQKILGHQSLSMTMKYAHLSKDHLKEAITLNPLCSLTLY